RIGAWVPRFAARGTAIAAFAIEHRLPTFTFQTRMARDGLLMSYEPDVPEMFRRTAAIVGKVLRGAKPADIPVEQPTQFRFVINLKTARAIGLETPPSVLARGRDRRLARRSTRRLVGIDPTDRRLRRA